MTAWTAEKRHDVEPRDVVLLEKLVREREPDPELLEREWRHR